MKLIEIKIKKGFHRSCLFPLAVKKGAIIIGQVRFRENCLFPPLDPKGKKICEGDWNKLIGIGNFYKLHAHWDSARLVWKPNTERTKIQIGRYMYVNRICPNGSYPFYCRGYNTDLKQHLSECEVDKWNDFSVIDNGDGYYFKFNDDSDWFRTKGLMTYLNKSGEHTRRIKKRRFKKTTVYAQYFGGNCTAPQDINIDFKLNI